MSGQVTPPVLQAPFANGAAPAFITNPLPVGSQIGITPGAASLFDGFPPVNFLDLTTGGGIAVSGEDMNAILFLISSWACYLAAGQYPPFNASLASAMSGYKLGARVGKADGSGIWFNLVDGNVNNPDSGGTGWTDQVPGAAAYMTAAVASGTNVNFNPAGFKASTGFIDCTVTTTAAVIGSLPGTPTAVNGQLVTISNSPSSTANLQLINTGTDTNPKFRMGSSPTSLLPGNSINLRYSTGAAAWLLV